MEKGNKTIIKNKIFDIDDFKQFIKRYQTALFTLKNYKHLHETLDKDIFGNDIKENESIRGQLGLILGGNMEEILLFFGVLSLYSLFEDNKNSKDTVSIYRILDSLENENFISNTLFFRGIRCELLKYENTILELKKFRDNLAHNFDFKKQSKSLFNINTKEIEEIIDYLGIIINGISKELNISTTEFQIFSEEIQDDYRKLFYFLRKQQSVGNIMIYNGSTDSEKISKIKTLYNLNI